MAAASAPVIGIIGGSGIYDIDGLANKEWRRVHTPWGEPSDDLLFGEECWTDQMFYPLSQSRRDHSALRPGGRPYEEAPALEPARH